MKYLKRIIKQSPFGKYIIALKHFYDRKMLYRVKRVINQMKGTDLKIEKQIKTKKEFHGNLMNGFMINPEGINSESIVYSFGVGEDISFDMSLINKYNLQIFAFDPTPISIGWINKNVNHDKFNFYEYGIADYDGSAKFFKHKNSKAISQTMVEVESDEYDEVKVFRLETIVKMLGHSSIDILKMNIEGVEYEVIKDILNSDLNIKQIIMSFHHNYKGYKIDKSKTKEAIENLNSKNYKIYYISSSGNEYSFSR